MQNSVVEGIYGIEIFKLGTKQNEAKDDYDKYDAD